MADLKGLKVAILIDDGFEQVEMTRPRGALDDVGAETSVVSPAEHHHVRGWYFTEWERNSPLTLLSTTRIRRSLTLSCCPAPL